MPWPFGPKIPRAAPPLTLQIRFAPCPDITAYELSQIILNCQGVHRLGCIPVHLSDWDNISANLKRHFVVVGP